jgi:hypothetical protein
MGVTGDEVFQALGDPNDVTVRHDFATRRQAEGFAASKRLREVMKGAGVGGRPTIWVVKEAGSKRRRRG